MTNKVLALKTETETLQDAIARVQELVRAQIIEQLTARPDFTYVMHTDGKTIASVQWEKKTRKSRKER